MSNNYYELFSNALLDQECWGFVAGSGAGSIIQLRFGRKIPEVNPSDNSNLSDEVRANRGEYELFIECAWRLDGTDKVVCGSTDSNEANGPMLKGLERLLNIKVKSVNCTKPAKDLKIEFENGLTFHLFCDQTNEQDDYDNYSIFFPNKVYIVKARGVVFEEVR